MMSTWLLQIAMNGLSQSPSPTPVARSRLRWAARESPFLIVSERIVRPFESVDIVGVSLAGSRRRSGRKWSGRSDGDVPRDLTIIAEADRESKSCGRPTGGHRQW